MKQSKIQLLENIKALDDSNEKLKEFLPKKNYKNLQKLEFSLIASINYANDLGFSITPAMLNNGLKTKLPLTIFGLNDYFGGYNTSNELILRSIPLWYLPNVEALGLGLPDLNHRGIYCFNPITLYAGLLEPMVGSYNKIFKGVIGFNTFYSILSLHTLNNITYGNLIHNLSDDLYLIQNIKVIFNIANITQLDNPLLFSKQNINGKIITDSIDLKMYVLPSSYQQTIIDIPLNIILDKNLIINQYIEFDCQNIQYIFTLLKIK